MTEKTTVQHSVCCYAGWQNNNRLLYYYQLISGRRISIKHLLLSSSSVILFGFSCRADSYKIPAQQQAVDVSGNWQSSTVTNPMRGILYFFDFIFYRTYTFYTDKGETDIPGVYALCVITLFPLLNISSLSFLLIDLSNVKAWNYSKPLLLLCFLAVLVINYIRIFRQIGISNFLTQWKVIDARKKKRMTIAMIIYLLVTITVLFATIIYWVMQSIFAFSFLFFGWQEKCFCSFWSFYFGRPEKPFSSWRKNLNSEQHLKSFITFFIAFFGGQEYRFRLYKNFRFRENVHRVFVFFVSFFAGQEKLFYRFLTFYFRTQNSFSK